MPTDRELDRAVAMKLFGWTCIHEPRPLTRDEFVAGERAWFEAEYGGPPPERWEGSTWLLETDYPPKKCDLCGSDEAAGGLYQTIPHFSTIDAVAVLDELRKRYDYVSVTAEGPLWTVECANGADHLRWTIIEDADTMGRALCAALLRALKE